MASRYYGSDRGETYDDITESSATTSKDVELVVDLAASLTKSEVLMKLDEIKGWITKGNWPPA